MNTIIINGKVISYNGGSIIVNNGKVIVDGAALELEDAPVFNITVTGDVEEISGEFSTVTVNGNAQQVKTMSGSVQVANDVNGSVSTMSGNVRAGGSIGGNVSTMSGNIR